MAQRSISKEALVNTARSEGPPRAASRAPKTPRLERIVFRTSRLLDFVGQRELTAQIGHAVPEPPSSRSR